jgi:hypothetical protein
MIPKLFFYRAFAPNGATFINFQISKMRPHHSSFAGSMREFFLSLYQPNRILNRNHQALSVGHNNVPKFFNIFQFNSNCSYFKFTCSC